jgi:shikimate dehydrogenase
VFLLEPELNPDLNNVTPNNAALRSRFLTGLVGRDILASRSPWLHEQEADALGLRLSYSLFDFTDRGWSDAELPTLLDALERTGFAGVNITFPFKQAVIAHLDDLTDEARRIGAVNTVSFRNGKRFGANTDVTGFAESFTRGLPGVATDNVLQIGAGGAGSATAQAMLQQGVKKLVIFDSDTPRLNALVAKLQNDFGADRAEAGADMTVSAGQADGIVNATPVGMAKLPGTPLPAALLEARHWVTDIVYFPLETELLFEAKQRGCKTLNGGGMAIHQAAGAFEIFTGKSADHGRMQKSFADFASSSIVRAL